MYFPAALLINFVSSNTYDSHASWIRSGCPALIVLQEIDIYDLDLVIVRQDFHRVVGHIDNGRAADLQKNFISRIRITLSILTDFRKLSPILGFDRSYLA